ncbi:MAG: subtilase family serine protease [Myxococcota bacterium]|jgi:subtilase family serine protease
MNQRSIAFLASVLTASLTTFAALPTALAGPDLVVTSISLDPGEPKVGEGVLTATIKNQGNEGTGVFVNINITMYLDGVECDTGLIIAGLGEGSEATEETSQCSPSTPGPHVIRFDVDTDGDVDEDNENNNSLEQTFIWTGPDLIVKSMSLDPATPNVTEGTLTFVFENIGPWEVDTGTFDKTNYTVAIDGIVCAESFIFDLDSGSTNEESTSDCGAMTPGPHEVTITIDSGNEVVEMDETNNTLTQTFAWQGGPDLTITDIVLDPGTPKVGEGDLTATIVNIGNQGTGILVNINLKMYLDGEACDTGLILAGLGEGSDTTEGTGSCNPDTPGEHTIRFEVDTDEDVIEADESNNFLEKTFTWTAADLIITDIVASADPLKPGESNTFTATILNQGSVDTDFLVNINLVMYLDDQECATGLLITGMNAGETAEEDTNECNAETAGPHVIRFEVDTDEDVVETDETNNVFEKTFIFCGDTELCNGFDDNCDGATDEGFDVGTACDGDDADSCENGIKACGADGVIVCNELEAAVEICDAADNDCDGQIDEDFTELGQLCEPEGECASGIYKCGADGGVMCSPGVPEACNELDDDCDGETDEDFPEIGNPCAAGFGACRTVGIWICGDGAATCDATPAAPGAEECGDGLDNDCDGMVDEGCDCSDGEYIICGIETGACSVGYQPCVNGSFAGTRQDAVKANSESCGTQSDDDCDGSINEGCSCDDGDTRVCGGAAGACAGGTQYCVGGAWSSCVSGDAPTLEECNGIDDDCDGVTDDGCPCAGQDTPCALAPDSCADYVSVCEAGQPWSPCGPVPGSEDPDCADDGGGAQGTGDDGGATTSTGGSATGGSSTTGGNSTTGGSGDGGSSTTGGATTGGATTGGADGGGDDAGTSDGTVDGDAPGAVEAASDGGCVASPAGSNTGSTWLLAFLLIGLLVSRRRFAAR